MRLFPKFPKVGRIPDYPPTKESITSVLILASLLVFLYALYGHWIISVFSLSVIGFKYWSIKQSITTNKYLPVGLLIIAFAILTTLFGGYSGRQSSLGLLTLLLALKVLESNNTRGYSVVCLLMYFLSAVIFAYEESSAAVITLLFSCLLITSCLAMLSKKTFKLEANHSHQKLPNTIKNIFKNNSWLVNTLKENSKILLQALPLTVLLFFLFPRIQGDFGFLPGDNLGKPRLENEMSAGDFSQNAFSNELAFRVEFKGPLPKREQLYWRSKVFNTESNFTWSKGEHPVKEYPIATDSEASNESTIPENIQYKVIHQATSDVKLPILETGISSSTGTLISDYTLLAKQQRTGAFEYEVTSNINTPKKLNAHINLNRYLQVSSLPGGKTTALMKKWQQESSGVESYVQKILTHFHDEPFKYTLKPPSLSTNDPVEDFLFNTRSGYCEHYASVFTLLMRWSGIPSRVVIGYQGGEWIEEGKFLEVRYSNAHAWSEIWINGYGWKRVDPTFAVAPERIEFGMDALFALWENDQIGSNISSSRLADMLRAQGINQAWEKLSNLSRSYGHRWDKWIVNFNHERQVEILKKLNLDGGNTIAKLLGLLFFGLILVGGFFLYRLLPKKVSLPVVDQYYQEFLKKLAKKDMTLNNAEGPTDFAQRASQLFPNNKADIHKITQYYINLKYDYREFNLQQFKAAVKQLDLQH